MISRNKILLTSMCFAAAATHAQESSIYTYELVHFDNALNLYQNKQFLQAQILFDQVIKEDLPLDIKADCAYYSAQCAIRLDQYGADVLMEDFVANYPTSSKQAQAYYEVASYYFNQNSYAKALKYFDKVNERNLSNTEREQFYFQKGYCYFAAKNKKDAERYFNRIVNSENFGAQAKYYIGYMAYEVDNYKQATEMFGSDQVKNKYQDSMGYFQADMNFKLGNFEKAIEVGTAQLSKANAQEKSDLNKIIGESYFNLQKYPEALPYLSQYKGKNGKWNNVDFYQLGYTYYKQGDYDNAIAQFNKILQGQDHVAQNAYYHLGESYLKKDQKLQALNAFKMASEMSFDPKIQEDAHLNYAKLSYEIGNPYQSVPEVLMVYIKNYPNSSHKAELEQLLINSYISSKNYKEALRLLENNRAPQNRIIYQKVAFYRGLELYADGDYTGAYDFFNKVISEAKDPEYTARAIFWKGETEYTLTKYNDALQSFRLFETLPDAAKVRENKNFNYNMAYAYFKVKDYENAAKYFQKYIDGYKKDDKMRYNDAYLRMADSYFVSSKYWPAMESYNKAIQLGTIDADYAAYQKAISYGFVSKNDRKIEDLTTFIKTYPNSTYTAEAMYELGNTYVNENKVNEAVKAYDNLIAKFPSSLLVGKSKLRQGLAYYNSNQNDKALEKFKKVAAEHPNTEEAVQAVETSRLIYMDLGKVNEFAEWVKTLDFIEISSAELDNDSYNSALKQYQQNNVKQAINGFTSYLAQFPNGLHVLKANFYLAEMYFADGLYNNAAKYYEEVVGKNRNEFTEQSLVRLSEIYNKEKNNPKSIKIFKRIESEADFPQNVNYAQANLMKAYYGTEDFVNAEKYANKVLSNTKVDDKIKSDAQIIIARSAVKTENWAKAQQAYSNLQKIATGELAAEALYYDAYFKNLDKKYAESTAAVQKLAKDYSGYKYFGSKGLIIMAKNFFATDDAFQATYILESVIKNFSSYPDVVEEAKQELAHIKGEAAQTNSSITN
ncbi:tetratricopeptide repeat protein [Flavobacterium agricola]|uniref:Tetratricopeptide repeat protein n=1 Tax=Flavobacterium agricola TaxID=2870839 RepID=A0ABY6LXW6_9FLAO|nr:tetratricopeptide repeat protein [Flavobacterium agricola]UYW00387.1 tetratricopeptide repeat protein [Flavobacterium agricola]